jgi:hypothetical protein
MARFIRVRITPFAFGRGIMGVQPGGACLEAGFIVLLTRRRK